MGPTDELCKAKTAFLGTAHPANEIAEAQNGDLPQEAGYQRAVYASMPPPAAGTQVTISERR